MRFFINTYFFKIYKSKENEQIFGLTENNRLFIGNKLITPECTSFQITNNFLIFTTNSPGMYHLLYVFDLLSPNYFLFTVKILYIFEIV